MHNEENLQIADLPEPGINKQEPKRTEFVIDKLFRTEFFTMSVPINQTTNQEFVVINT